MDGRPSHSNYAPCKLEALKESGYDYWALGHIHQFEILHEQPWIVFPGNIQGRHIRESGPKGCVLVTVVEGEVSSVAKRSLDVARWSRTVLKVDGLDDRDAILAAAAAEFDKELVAAGENPIALRLGIEGISRAHHDITHDADGFLADCQMLANDRGQGQIWVERVTVDSRAPIDIELMVGGDSPLGHLLQFIRGLPNDSAMTESIWSSLNELRQKLPPEVVEDGDYWNLTDSARLMDWLPGVENMLIPRLIELETKL